MTGRGGEQTLGLCASWVHHYRCEERRERQARNQHQGLEGDKPLRIDTSKAPLMNE